MKTTDLALIKKDVVDVVSSKVQEFVAKGELHLPPNYSPENAMKSAWLILQNTQDKNKKPVLQVCTKDSIANALLDMVVQGLNPAKMQGYFIAYGNQLVFQRSYFGTMAVAKRVSNAKDILAEIIYGGDEFEYEILHGKKKIIKHKQKFENIRNDNILGAYCTILFSDGREYTQIMTLDQIKQAWLQSPNYREDSKNGKNGVHQKFTEEMAKKTVINRTCKQLINSSDDNDLVIERFNRADEIAAEAKIEDEIAAEANSEIIDIEGDIEGDIEDGVEVTVADDRDDTIKDAKENKQGKSNRSPIEKTAEVGQGDLFRENFENMEPDF